MRKKKSYRQGPIESLAEIIGAAYGGYAMIPDGILRRAKAALSMAIGRGVSARQADERIREKGGYWK